MAEAAGSARTRLIAAIDARRECIDDYVCEKRPSSTRLSTISIVSSAIAAALTAGPALGGRPFAETVQDGLALAGTDQVWQPLCFAALAVSVTAAISANLSRTNDLTSRIATAEAAAALLEGVRTRLEFGRLPVEDAAQEYQDIVARIPFVPEKRDGDSAGRSRSRKRADRGTSRLRGVPLVGAAVAALATLMLTATLVGAGIGLTRPDADPTAVPATSSGPAAPATGTSGPPTTAAPADVSGVFSGAAQVDEAEVPLVIAIEGPEATAYLCDGDTLEAWLDGAVTGNELTMVSAGGMTLTATIDGDVVSGETRNAEQDPPAAVRAERAPPPAGVYEDRPEPGIRVGWAVLSDGTQLGITNRNGERSPAPPLDMETLTYPWADGRRPAHLREPV